MLRRHARGTSVIVTLLLAGGLVALAAWYVTDRPAEYRAEAAVAVVPAGSLDDSEALEAYGALSGHAVESLAEIVQRQAAPAVEEDGGRLSVAPVGGSSVIAATGTAETRGAAEEIADDAASEIAEGQELLPGPFDFVEVSDAAGTAAPVDPPWVRWGAIAGAALIGLLLFQWLVYRALSRRRRSEQNVEVDATTPVEAPAPIGMSNGACSNGNGSHGPIEELSPITWSAPPPS